MDTRLLPARITPLPNPPPQGEGTGCGLRLAHRFCSSGSTAHEAIFGAAVEVLARPQHGGREIRMMRRIREVLRLQAKPRHARVLVGDAAAAAVAEKLAGVELHARLGGPH